MIQYSLFNQCKIVASNGFVWVHVNIDIFLCIVSSCIHLEELLFEELQHSFLESFVNKILTNPFYLHLVIGRQEFLSTLVVMSCLGYYSC